MSAHKRPRVGSSSGATNDYIVTEGGTEILLRPTTHSTLDDLEAWSRLIAAAPDLLAELERLYEAARCMADSEHCLHAYRDTLPWGELAKQARAALALVKPAQARGEGRKA